MAALQKGGAKELLSSTTTANIQLKGMKLRQEFCCPITYDLMRDPVVLADGEHYVVIPLYLLFSCNYYFAFLASFEKSGRSYLREGCYRALDT